MRERSDESCLLTRSGLAQWPFSAVETLPRIRSFICWVASGLSLRKQNRSPVSHNESCEAPLPNYRPRLFYLLPRSKTTSLVLRGLR